MIGTETVLGKWCCLSIWQLPEPERVPTCAIATLVALWLGLVGFDFALAGETPTAEVDVAAVATASGDPVLANSITRVLTLTHPDIKSGEMLEYYSLNSPDVLVEIRSQVESSGAHDPGPYLRRLADHFTMMERVKRRSPTEFSRLVALEQLESRSRVLGQRIQQLTALVAEGSKSDSAAAKKALATAREELQAALERSFDESQQNQRIELNRLDAELRAMRRLIDEREVKRDLILRQRYLQFSGQEMPAQAKASAADNVSPAR